MKKKLILVLLVLLSTSIYAKEFEGFLGIKFNDSVTTVCKTMSEMNWNIDYRSSSKCTFNKPNATYNGIPVDKIQINFNEDKCTRIYIQFSTSTSENYSKSIVEIYTDIIEANELKFYDSRKDKGKYSTGTSMVFIDDNSSYMCKLEVAGASILIMGAITIELL